MTTTPESQGTDREDAVTPTTPAAPGDGLTPPHAPTQGATEGTAPSTGPEAPGAQPQQSQAPAVQTPAPQPVSAPAPQYAPHATADVQQPQHQQHAVPQQPVAQQHAVQQPAATQQHAAHQQHATQPTVQLPEHGVPSGLGIPAPAQQGASGGAGGTGTPGEAFGAAAVPAGGSAHPKSRTGSLLAGLAIGALLGGLVGGGVAALVSSNNAPQNQAQGGTITLNNAENATAISGVAAVATPSVVTLEVSGGNASGSGSGVIYSEDGYIITNAHVVTLDGAAMQDANVRVKFSDGRILSGSVVGVDPYADLAVVKVDATGLPAIKVADSDKLDVGDLTVAIGAPLNLANTVTSGVVSALNRGISVGSPLIPQDPTPQQDDEQQSPGFPWDFRFGLPDNGQQQEEQQQQQQSGGGAVTLPVIQTDASINPGNSGGALLNGKGELIGINVAIASAAASNGAAGSDGLGFAIPANLATRVADAIIAGEQPSHGLLGASVADSTQDTDEDAGHAGGLLVDVTRDGAAAKAGLKAGDVVTAVDGVPAVSGTSVSALIRMHEGGSTVKIDYLRGGKAGQTEATLGKLEW